MITGPLYFLLVMLATKGGSAIPIENAEQSKYKTFLRTNYEEVVNVRVEGYLDMPALNRTYIVGEYSTQPKTVQYVVFMNKLNWYDAASFCKARGMDLATVRSEAENQLIINAMDQAGIPRVEHQNGVWLGGANLESDHGYYWITDGQSFSNSFTNWGDSPDNWKGIQHCVHYWFERNAWQWDDYECTNIIRDTTSPFACETRR